MSQYQYDPRASQYRNKENGRLVGRAKILELLDTERARLETSLTRLTSQLQNGSVTVAQWQREFYEDLKRSHIRMGLLAGGGKNAPYSKNLYGAIGQNLRSQQEFLVQFRRDIQKGKYKDNPEKLKWRARLYADSIRDSFNDGEKIARNTEGFDLAKRVRDPQANSCDDCRRYASSGWVPISEVVPPKTRCECKWRCRCHLIWKRSYTPVWTTKNFSLNN